MDKNAISELFRQYIASMEDQEYHTEAAVHEVKELEAFLDEHVSDFNEWTEHYDKAMNLAVEFEESGFIAGFETAARMFAGIQAMGVEGRRSA